MMKMVVPLNILFVASLVTSAASVACKVKTESGTYYVSCVTGCCGSDSRQHCCDTKPVNPKTTVTPKYETQKTKPTEVPKPIPSDTKPTSDSLVTQGSEPKPAPSDPKPAVDSPSTQRVASRNDANTGSSKSDDTGTKSSVLSSGTVIGIIVGAILLVVIIVVIVVFCMCCRSSQRSRGHVISGKSNTAFTSGKSIHEMSTRKERLSPTAPDHVADGNQYYHVTGSQRYQPMPMSKEAIKPITAKQGKSQPMVTNDGRFHPMTTNQSRTQIVSINQRGPQMVTTNQVAPQAVVANQGKSQSAAANQGRSQSTVANQGRPQSTAANQGRPPAPIPVSGPAIGGAGSQEPPPYSALSDAGSSQHIYAEID